MPHREKNPVRQAMGKAGASARWGKDYGGPSIDEFRNEEGMDRFFVIKLYKLGNRALRLVF